MKIKKLILTNFSGYKNSTAIDFNDLTVFVGRNDIGKSTILKALDLFLMTERALLSMIRMLIS